MKNASQQIAQIVKAQQTKNCKICEKNLGQQGRFKNATYCSLECALKDKELVEFIKTAESKESVTVRFNIHRSLIIKILNFLNIRNENFEKLSEINKPFKYRSNAEKNIRKCRRCKKLFEQTNPSNLFCSEECKNKKKSICTVCQKKHSKKSNYCSTTCAASDTNLVHALKIAKSIDPIRKKFKISYKRIIEIINLLNIKNENFEENKEKLGKPIEVKNCLYCNKPFKPKERKRMYCSTKCSYQHLSALRRKAEGNKHELKKARRIRRKINVKKATPETANTKLINLIYKHRPEGYHVDHIVPISKGGLHHQDNLQYMIAEENIKKHNKIDFESKNVIRWQDVININDDVRDTNNPPNFDILYT